jgi:hypothetical protein
MDKTKRNLVLFVASDYYLSQMVYERSEMDYHFIVHKLAETADIVQCKGLMSQETKNSLEIRTYDALITHLPFNYPELLEIHPDATTDSEMLGEYLREYYLERDIVARKDYTIGLEKIKDISSRYPKMPVIVWTGADKRVVTDEIILEAGAKKVARRRESTFSYIELRGCLEELLEKNKN